MPAHCPCCWRSGMGSARFPQGLKWQGKTLQSLGIEPDRVSFGGGAGGSTRRSGQSARDGGPLRAMAARPEFAAYDAALPILGRDGTLARAVGTDSPARGHARAKTGTYFVINDLDGKAVLTSKALAGYLETASGRSLIFAVFVNNVPLDAPRPDRSIHDATAAAGRLLGKICEALYADSGDAGRSSDSSGAPAGTIFTTPASPSR